MGVRGTDTSLSAKAWLHFESPVAIEPSSRAHTLADGSVLFSDAEAGWLWRLAPQEAQWSSVPMPRGVGARRNANVVVGGGYVFLWGGERALPGGACEETEAESETPCRAPSQRLTDGVMRRL